MDELRADTSKESSGSPAHDDPSEYPSVNELHERANSLEEDGLLELIENATIESQDLSYTDSADNYLYYQAKPLHVILFFSTLALLLIVGQLYIPVLNEFLGEPLEYPGWIRLCMLILGGYCIFMAWPYRKQINMDDAELAARASSIAEFQAKCNRWRE
jgi:hypothetical protein